MKVDKVDRRVARTQTQLQAALISLMLEQGYEQCTVQHILDRAEVSRSTFYAHFSDKEALFVSSIANLRAGLTQQWRADLDSGTVKGQLGFVRPFLAHVDGSHHVWRAFVKGESGRIMDREFRQMLTSMANRDLGVSKSSPPAHHIAVACVVGALMSLVETWMARESRSSAAEMNELFLRITLPGLQELMAG